MPFLLFVVVGTLALMFLFSATQQRESRRKFIEQAEENARFLRAIHLPAKDRFAEYLGQVLNVDAYFRRSNTGEPPRPGQGVVPIRDGNEAVAAKLDDAMDLVLVRHAPPGGMKKMTWLSLVIFWALSMALAWAVVRPYLEAQRLALRGQMATALAHEIQNPVAAIRLHGQLAGHDVIVSEAAAIESLVNQWMFLAKPEPPQKTPVALKKLLADTINALTPLADHARVRIECTGTGAMVEADVRRLGQAFRNVIINAIQAMPGGGTLRITAKDKTVEFADTGSGFSPTALQRYAEMFFTEKEGGMGIGLNVTQEIVKAHGGRLSVANRSEGGAVVRIEL